MADDERPFTGEARLLGRAIRERWPIPAAAKVNALRRLNAIIRDPKSSDRNRIAAIRVLIAADVRNQDQQRLDLLSKVTSGDQAAAIIEGCYDLIASRKGRGDPGSDPG